MSEIYEVRERLAAIAREPGARVSAESDDIRAMLADHARLQAKLGKLQAMQARMRDPERQMVCDIIANGVDRETAGVGRYEVPYAQPAPAIDLEQFRDAVELVEWQHRGHDNPDFPRGNKEKHAEALRLLALIDGQANPHPEGTPMMPAGRFYDGCWKLAPEGVRHHACMLTQSWRAADSSELKRALEAGVLALIDGQAKCQTCGTVIKSHPLTGTICDCAMQPTKGEGE